MKKLTAMALTGILAISLLAGCSGNDSKEETKAETKTEATEAGESDDTTAAESSDDTAEADKAGTTGSGDVFVIGGIGPLTGDAASYGTSVKQGAEIAINEINAGGGVTVGDKTYELKLEFADDEATEDKAVTAYQTLMDKGIDALLGTVTSGACLAVVDLTAEDGLLQVTPSGSAQDITVNDNVFRICFTDPLQGQKLAEYAADTLGVKKIAIIYNNSDDYSTGLKNAFTETYETLGGSVVTAEAFQEGDVDFSTQLTKIKGTDAEMILVPAYYQAAAYITQQAKELGMELPFIGSDGWDGVIDKVTDLTAIEGAVFLSPFLATDEAVKDFTDAYTSAYSATPDQFAADGYDGVYAIAKAMETAGSIESADLIAAMHEIELEGLTGSMKFDENGEPQKDAKYVKIENGEYTAVK